jgi:spore maturation protein CgeB
MSDERLSLVILGLSITSSWGNGHATTFRALVRELHARGHQVLFLERDQPWYAENRDMPHPPHCRTAIYRSVDELRDRFADQVRTADAVIVGSYVPEGIAVGDWVLATARGLTAFYDIDTPVTIANLTAGQTSYLAARQVAQYGLYWSFTGGPMLRRLETEFGSPCARALYCSFDPDLYFPEPASIQWDLGYLGTYSDDRQPTLERLMLDAARRWPAGRFIVAGPQYPPSIEWPGNVEREIHISPAGHRSFYTAQRFTLNVTRADMVRAGWSPSVRLFEAAACAVPIISDDWPGLSELFEPGRDLLVSRSAEETLRIVRDFPEEERAAIGARARARVLGGHTAGHRAQQVEHDIIAARERRVRAIGV